MRMRGAGAEAETGSEAEEEEEEEEEEEDDDDEADEVDDVIAPYAIPAGESFHPIERGSRCPGLLPSGALVETRIDRKS